MTFIGRQLTDQQLINHIYVIGHEFGEIMQNNDHYAVQGHSRSPTLVPIESPYTTSYWWLILTYLLSCTVSKLWLIICQIFTSDRESLHFNTLVGGDSHFPANIAMSDMSLKLDSFGYISLGECIGVSSATSQKASELGEITQTTRILRCSRSFKVTNFSTNRKPICDFLLVINSNLPSILFRFQVTVDYMYNFR